MVPFCIKLHFWSFWICLFAGFPRQITLTDANILKLNTILTEHAELLKTVKAYEIVKPYRLEGRRKRHASTRLLNQDSHIEETTLVLDGVKHRFTLDITLNKGLFSPDYRETRVLRDGTRTVGQKQDNCFYHGTVQEDSNATVSLSTCDGIEGIIRTNKGSFFIHPLKSKEGNVLEEHLVFSSNDMNDEPVTCGHNHKISLKKEFDHHKKIPNSKRRVRRNIKNEMKYLELFLINDNAQYKKLGEGTELRAKQLANHLDSIYRFQNIRIALVLVETWQGGNPIVVDENATKALSNFITYKKKTLDKDKGKHWDNVQLITGIDFKGSTVGYAPIRSICGSRSAAVVQDHSKTAAVTASTMAHELGHNLGMRHDTATCECPASGECVMSAFLSAAVTRFSTCSLNQLSETLEQGYGTCLFDKPNKLFGPAICGNGYVEESEQCDCGTQAECDHFENKCCNVTTCMLFPEAACGHGECCDKCQFRSRGHLCREKHDDCDLPEHCTGNKEVCPEDTYVHDGIPCKDDIGYCYGGVCRALTLQCQYLFGETVTAGKDVCFNRNMKGGNFYGCYNDTHGNHPCAKRDVKCGKLHCLSDKKKFPIKGQDRHYSSVFDGTSYCLTPGVTVGDGQDLEYVQAGTKCGTDMMCKDSKCIPVTVAVPTSAYDKCKKNCSGNGICNHKGNCHCNSGYACPDCSNTGHDRGGSIDSGQGCEETKKVCFEPETKPGSSNITVEEHSNVGINLAAAILIPLFIVILIIVIVVVVYRYRTAIQDRLNRYKLVRRTVARSSSEAGSRRTGVDRPTIIGPTTIEFKPSDTESNLPLVRREPPPRPLAPSAPMGNEKQPSWGTPAQPSWGTPAQPSWGTPAKQPSPVRKPPSPVRKPPPSVPTHLRGQPRTGHQSVPLFPPSAVPEPQESVKPRRPPSGPPTGPDYENLPPTSAPKPLPARPKVPPSHNTPGHSSLPDLVSPAKPKTPPVTPGANAAPRPKPRVPPGSHRSVPEFPDDLPVPKPRNVAPRPGHLSVPLFNLPDASDGEENVQSVRPSAVKANQAKASPPRRPRTTDNKPVDFRAGLKAVPKPWDKS